MANSANFDKWVEDLAELLSQMFTPDFLAAADTRGWTKLRRKAVQRAIRKGEERLRLEHEAELALMLLATAQAERHGLTVGPPQEQLRVES